MENEKLNQLLNRADTVLNSAREELNHPADDVVNYSVCVFARSALYHYLELLQMIYAQKNKDEVKESPTLEELINYCSNFNDKLKGIDFSEVYCKDCNVLDDEKIYYCNNVNKVTYCTDVAEKVRELVVEQSGAGHSLFTD